MWHKARHLLHLSYRPIWMTSTRLNYSGVMLRGRNRQKTFIWTTASWGTEGPSWPSTASCGSDDCETQRNYTVGDLVYYFKAPNLGGMAGTAALQVKWLEAVIAEFTTQSGSFQLYRVEDQQGFAAGTFSKADLRPRKVRWFETPVPKGWINAPSPHPSYGPTRKRLCR